MIGTKHLQKNKNICTLSTFIQPNLDAITRKKIICTLSILTKPNLVPIARKIIIVDSTSKIKIPVKLIRFLLCFLLLNENFEVGIGPSGNILVSLKYSSMV